MGTVTQLRPREAPATPEPDPDAPATARYLTRLGWTASEVLHSGMGLDVWAAMLAREMADEAGPSCPA